MKAKILAIMLTSVMLSASLTVSAGYLAESQKVSSTLVNQESKDFKTPVYLPYILKDFICVPEILKNIIYKSSEGLEPDDKDEYKDDKDTETLNIVIYPPKAGGVKLETATSSNVYYEDVSLTFRTGTKIKLTAIEGKVSVSPGYEFYRWIGDSTPSEIGPSINIVMDSDKKFIACFIQKTESGPKNDIPFAYFTFKPKNPEVGDEIKFDGSYSYDPDHGDIVDYKWSYSDSNNERRIDMGSGETITYSWNRPGTYTVTLVVTDDERDSNRVSKQVVVTGEADFYRIEYKVEPPEGGSVILNPGGPEYKAGTVVKVTAVANPGYKFNEWRGSITGTEESVEIIMNSNKEFIANFTDGGPDKYTLDVRVEPSDECGEVVLDPDLPEYEPGTVVKVTAVANPGYKFNEWRGSITGTEESVEITMDADKEIAANFTETQEEFRLIACAVPLRGGEVELDPPGPLYNAGQVVTLTAVANSGYRFERWDGDIEDDGESVNITMDADKAVLAIFTENQIKYRLEVNILPSDGGSVTLSPSGGIYDPGTVVTLTASANSGFRFVEWVGDIEGNSESSTIDITMDDNKAVTASFTEESIKYSLIVNIYPSNTAGSVILDPPGNEYDPGTVVNITAIANYGYEFDRWGNDDSGTRESIEVEMNSDKTINAVFDEMDDLKVSIVSPRYNRLNIFGREITSRFRKDIKPRIIGPVTVEVDIENASGEVLLELYVDNELEISDTTLGHIASLTWNERAFRKHTIKIKATDEINRCAEDSIDVVVFNLGLRK